MARISRIVVPGYPHHVTQRGVRSMAVFRGDEDRLEYLRFMSEETARFGSCVLDERHLIAAARYVELNPVWAMLVKLPWEFQWSSAAFHTEMRKVDPLVRDKTLRGLVKDWRKFLLQDESGANELLKSGVEIRGKFLWISGTPEPPFSTKEIRSRSALRYSSIFIKPLISTNGCTKR